VSKTDKMEEALNKAIPQKAPFTRRQAEQLVDALWEAGLTVEPISNVYVTIPHPRTWLRRLRSLLSA
jgi:hypothetical protein